MQFYTKLNFILGKIVEADPQSFREKAHLWLSTIHHVHISTVNNELRLPPLTVTI